MQPTENAGYVGELPETGYAAHEAVLVKRHKWISVVLRPQTPGQTESAVVLTLHQNEAKKLAENLLEVVAAPVREDFVDETWLGTEGVYLGGPPRRDQLVELNPDLLPSPR